MPFRITVILVDKKKLVAKSCIYQQPFACGHAISSCGIDLESTFRLEHGNLVFVMLIIVDGYETMQLYIRIVYDKITCQKFCGHGCSSWAT
jgi:hypothetical protein